MSTLLSIHWNANPEFFSIGSISVRWYGLMFALGFLAGYQIMYKMFKFESSNTEWLDKLFIYTIVATIVGARLGHVFFYGWNYYSQHLIEIVLPISKVGGAYKFVGYQGLASPGNCYSHLYFFKESDQKVHVLDAGSSGHPNCTCWCFDKNRKFDEFGDLWSGNNPALGFCI
jgi:hypothetical protein